MEWLISALKENQLNLMLIMSGICLTINIFIGFTKTLTKRRKRSMILMELSAATLLISDRYAYIFRGNTSTLGFYMVRITNFLVFVMSLIAIRAFNDYLDDLYDNEGKVGKRIKRLELCNYLTIFGIIGVFISQFTGFYYYFDEMNRYTRGPGFVVCYIVPLSILLIQLSVIIQYRQNVSRRIFISLFLFTTLPLVATVVQMFIYGISFTNLTIVGMSILIYLFAIIDLNETVEKAKNREIEILQKEQKDMQELFEQTARSLASAIDAKDPYTHGHSDRVAKYSKMIAEKAGFSPEESEKVYYAALLHDVGKIGIPDEIINKKGKLTDDEFNKIKEHPTIGNEILSNIQNNPYLRNGAHFHHERYDGKGYPSHLSGEQIPELARIIAVADSYDAMTSNRSYRSYLSQERVREELVKGLGTQFDPKFAQIMIDEVDKDKTYQMRQHSE